MRRTATTSYTVLLPRFLQNLAVEAPGCQVLSAFREAPSERLVVPLRAFGSGAEVLVNQGAHVLIESYTVSS